MPLILSGNVASATASTTYDVANSCRFNDGDSAAMSRDQSANDAGTNTKGTLSVWLKMSAAGTEQVIYTRETDASNYFKVWFENDKLLIQTVTSGSVTMKKETNRVFRDPGAWLNIVVILDSTDGTAEDRQQIWINGTRETSFANSTNIGSSANLQINTGTGTDYIGRRGSGNYYDGYMAELVWIDGTDYAATSFGEFNEDSPNIWQPIKVSGLTFGTNGFYLDFEASGNLGNDVSGGTDFTEANLAATDQMTDTCTNNFCTMNPLDKKVGGTYTFSEGNLQVEQDIIRGSLSNFGITAGKWYAEAKFVSTNSDSCRIGIVGISNVDNDNPGKPATGYVYDQDGNKSNNNTAASYGDTYSTGDIIGIAVDLDNLKIYFSKNGTFQDSGDPTSGSTGTGAAYTITAASATPAGAYFFTHCDNADTNKVFWNFGSPAYSISSGNADGNGYGNFEYAVPSGYYSLCTKNLAEYGG